MEERLGRGSGLCEGCDAWRSLQIRQGWSLDPWTEGSEVLWRRLRRQGIQSMQCEEAVKAGSSKLF